ncbi:MAG: hypothetical protein K5637_01410 [Lachnospiraceae bacterium]|nr:hypothetical protein [Lachnospiraceae bacterium]
MIAGMTYYQICWYFLLYSFAGWVIEVMYHAVTLGKVVNRGFLNGPVCPVYGFGMLGVLGLMHTISVESEENLNPFLLFLVGVVLATIVELIAGWVLDKLFHARWWDYSNKPFNLHGYICLEFSLIWGFAVVLIVRIIHPMLADLPDSFIPERYGWPILACLYALYLVDLICTVMIILKFNKRITELDELQKKLRIVSDRMSERIGTDTVKAAQTLQEGQIQAALGKAELKEDLEERKADLQKRRLELESKITAHQLFGAGRILHAFPTYNHHDHESVVSELRQRLRQRINN